MFKFKVKKKAAVKSRSFMSDLMPFRNVDDGFLKLQNCDRVSRLGMLKLTPKLFFFFFPEKIVCQNW